MKIAIKIKTDTIIAVHKTLQKIYDMPVSTEKRQKVYKSIGFDLADIFEKRFKKIIKDQTLFDKKTSKVSLKFHEAWALQEILTDLLHSAENPFIKHLMQGVIDQLDQKTC